jgi:hypothetical protein
MVIMGVKMNFGYMSKSYMRTYNARTSYSQGRGIYTKSTTKDTTTGTSTKSSEGGKIKSLLSNFTNSSNPTDFSQIASNITAGAVGFKFDKGTAASTTVEVDKGTYNEIIDYSMNNKDYKWDEVGCDGTKKWVVIDGQRFDYSLSKSEKEAFSARWKTCCSFYNNSEIENYNSNSKAKDKHLVSITLDKDNKAIVNKDEKESENSKITSLMKKPKVVKMLSDIMRINNRKSISLDLE